MRSLHEASERVRMAYQDEGYCKVQVEAKASPIDPNGLARWDILVRVLQPGQQYRLGQIGIIHATVFPEKRLRDMFPIQRGEIFSREKIAKGLQDLRRLYGSLAYLNFVYVPNTTFDEDSATANLEIDVDQGRQFRWGNLHADGMRDQDRAILLAAWEGWRGQVYRPDNRKLDEFLRKYFYPLRKGVRRTECSFKKVDGFDGTVDVYLTFVGNPDITTRRALRQVVSADRFARDRHSGAPALRLSRRGKIGYSHHLCRAIDGTLESIDWVGASDSL